MNSSGCYQWQKEIIWSPETSCVQIPADALFTDCWVKSHPGHCEAGLFQALKQNPKSLFLLDVPAIKAAEAQLEVSPWMSVGLNNVFTGRVPI